MNIPEFRNKDYFDEESLNQYYEIIKDAPVEFLTELKDKVMCDLFVYSDERLSNITNEFKRLMTLDDLKNLASKLT